jgi:predicted transcriptional regulator
MYEKANIVVTKIPKLIERYQGALKFQAAEAPYFLYEKKNNKKTEINVLKTLSYLLDDMKYLLEEE